MRRTLSGTCGVFALLLAASAAPAQLVLRSETTDQLRTDVAAMQSLVHACEARAAGCDASQVAQDAKVGEPGKNGGYAVHWEWLRNALNTAQKAKDADRAADMRDDAVRLDSMAKEIAAPAPGDNGYSVARTQTDRILSQAEFQDVSRPSWYTRLMARIWSFLGRAISGVSSVGRSAPWLGTLLEWGFFLAAAAGMVFFIFRGFSQQRLQVALNEGRLQQNVWDREATDWAKLADKEASEGNWREAVHGLYWAAIVHLEARRAWRHNPSRTPREYVRLLKPGSAQQTGLRTLTQIFERVWYGFGEIGGSDYERARATYEGLSQAKIADPGAAEETPR